jgi:hypothetical protein
MNGSLQGRNINISLFPILINLQPFKKRKRGTERERER